MEGIFEMSIYEYAIQKERRKESKNAAQVRRRILTGVAIILGGAAIYWGTQASLVGVPTVGQHFRAEQVNEEGSSQARITNATWRTEKGAEEADSSQLISTDFDPLILVNKEHALPANYSVTLHWLANGSCAVAEEMYEALSNMLTAGSDAGLEFVVASGYCDAAYQQRLLEEDIQASMSREGMTWQQAYEKETQETMPPGYSEHETGLAVDIVSLGYQILDSGQENTPENKWLREHCSDYGFILRYPEGKGDITGIHYETWHFRYVGDTAAREIMGRGITLEEYLDGK